jgi:Acyl-CoA carboxylase epsilon subunit
VNEEQAPLLRVIKGDPTPEELAAVIVVLSERAASATAEPAVTDTRSGGWSAYWRNVRAPLSAGPGAWRNAGRLG